MFNRGEFFTYLRSTGRFDEQTTVSHSGHCLSISTDSTSYLRILKQMEHQFVNGFINIYLN
jgi:hypothetical protein